MITFRLRIIWINPKDILYTYIGFYPFYPGNYRPVSLTSQLGKMCERVIREVLVDFVERNQLIKESQHGFRKGKSCLTNLLDFLENVTNLVDKGIPVDVIYLDFQKAFDKVPHQRLLYKLRKFGVSEQVTRWIKVWLENRRQRVVIQGEYSDWETVWSGVPQGSVLGPILFILFIDDIDEDVISKVWKFADDTKLMGRVDDEESRGTLQLDLSRMFGWSKDWMMLFNADKCGVMHIGAKNEREELRLDGALLKELSEEKDLGVIVQNDLKVNKQCIKAANSANRMLGMIKRNFVCKDKDVIMPLYKTLVRPHLDYCVQAWRPHLVKDVTRLEKIQRRATKMIRGCEKLDYEGRVERLGLTRFEMRMRRADLIEVFKIMNGLEGIDEKKFFERSTRDTRGHGLRL